MLGSGRFVLGPFLSILLTTMASKTSASLNWGPEERLTTNTTVSETGLNHGALAVDSQLQLTAAWAEQDGPNNNFRIYTRGRHQNGTWDPQVLAVDFDTSYAGVSLGAKFPALVTLFGDTLLMVWHDYRIAGINNLELFTKVRPPGMPWGGRSTEVRLTTSNHPESGGDNSYLPNLAIDRSGTAHVAWYDYRFDGSNAEILFKSRSGGAWDVTPGDVADQNASANVGDSNYPALETSPDGTLNLLWRDNTDGAFRIYYRRKPPGQSWAPPVILSPPGVAADGAALAVASDGTVIAVWADARTGNKAIYVAQRTPAGTWGSSRRASPAAGAEEPDIAVDPSNRRYLVWQDARISAFNREIFFQSIPPGASWDSTGSSDTQLSAGSGKSSRPTLLVDAAYQVHVLWQDARNGATEIYYRSANNPAVAVWDSPSPRPFRAWPNPFGRVLHLQDLSVSARRVEVLDIRGAWVVSIPVAGGQATWDGRQNDGSLVPPGIYFLRIDTPEPQEKTRTVKVVRTR
jgi:hypothetical protein